jgi:hypothetical protein
MGNETGEDEGFPPTEPKIIFDQVGVSLVLQKSEARSRQYFKSGRIPTEILINGKRPAVTSETLKEIADGEKWRC